MDARVARELAAEAEGLPARGALVRLLAGVHRHVRREVRAPLELGLAVHAVELVVVVCPLVHPQRRAGFRRLTAHVADELSAVEVRLYVVLEVTVPGKLFEANVTGVRAVVPVQRARVARQVPAVAEAEPARLAAEALHAAVGAHVPPPRRQHHSLLANVAHSVFLAVFHQNSLGLLDILLS